MKLKYYKRNQAFIKNNPYIKLPNDYIIFESFQLDYNEFFYGGIETAKYIIKLFNRFIVLDKINILEWGCGPGRIIQHFPELTNSNCHYFATDYNPKSIDWCIKNIKDVHFQTNEINPPLKYSNNYFDIIYGISVLTHLSESNYYSWFNELIRITKPNGLILLTTHGVASLIKLREDEKKLFKQGNLIEKRNTLEGHRTFTSYSPELFMKKLFKIHSEIIFYKRGKRQDWGIEKDFWIIKKNNIQ